MSPDTSRGSIGSWWTAFTSLFLWKSVERVQPKILKSFELQEDEEEELHLEIEENGIGQTPEMEEGEGQGRETAEGEKLGRYNDSDAADEDEIHSIDEGVKDNEQKEIDGTFNEALKELDGGMGDAGQMEADGEKRARKRSAGSDDNEEAKIARIENELGMNGEEEEQDEEIMELQHEEEGVRNEEGLIGDGMEEEEEESFEDWMDMDAEIQIRMEADIYGRLVEEDGDDEEEDEMEEPAALGQE